MKGPDQTSLVIGCSEPSFHRARAVFDGTLTVADCTVRYVKLGPGEVLQRSFDDPELNIAELSLSGCVTRIARGDCPYVLLPVYIARMFPHAAFYARTDRGISSLADLRGKRVGSSAYQRTLNVWARGFLRDEHDVSARDVQWVIRDTPDAVQARQPPGVRMETVRTTAKLGELLETGELDAIIAAHPPECLTRGFSRVKRVMQDHDQAAAGYFGRTGVFPILHVMGIRRELVQAQPQIASDLLAAFSKARELAFAAGDGHACAWLDAAHCYGLGARERDTLALFLNYHENQGLSERQPAVADLFAPVAIAQYGLAG